MILVLGFLFTYTLEAQFLNTSGKNIVDSTGSKLILKGTNLGNWLVSEGYMFHFKDNNSPAKINRAFNELIGPQNTLVFWDKYLDTYIQYEDIVYLKSIGCNHVRLPFHYKLLTNEDYLNKDCHGFKYIDSTVAWCKRAGLYVLLDMHCAPGGQTGDNIDDSFGYPYLFTDTMSQNVFVKVWKEIAIRYQNEPTVLGYDLINEPIAHYFKDSDSLTALCSVLYKRTVQEIREIDTNHIIFLGGTIWNTNFKVFNQILDDNIVYEFHKYWMPPVQAEIQQYVDFSNKHNVPVYLGESGENTNEWIYQFRKVLDSNSISWAFWPYKKMNNDKCIRTIPKHQNYMTVLASLVEADRRSYQKLRELNVDREEVLEIINSINEKSGISVSKENAAYIKALFGDITN